MAELEPYSHDGPDYQEQSPIEDNLQESPQRTLNDHYSTEMSEREETNSVEKSADLTDLFRRGLRGGRGRRGGRNENDWVVSGFIAIGFVVILVTIGIVFCIC